MWMFVHLTFLDGFGATAPRRCPLARAVVGRDRVERVFSVAHTGGDLSTPGSVRAIVQPTEFPAVSPETR